MDNDNIKRDENIDEELLAKEPFVDGENNAEDTVIDDEVIAEEKNVAEDTESIDAPLTEESVAIDITEDKPEEIADEVELTEEDLAKIEAFKKIERKKTFLTIALVAIIIVAVAAFFVCYTEGVGSNNIVSGAGTSDISDEGGFFAKLKTDNIRYESPVVNVFDKVTGKNKDAVMKINGAAVDKDVLNFVANSSAVNYMYSLIQTGVVTDIAGFDWGKIDEQTGLSYLEISKSMAVETLIPIYATITEGEKQGILFTEDDEKEVRKWIDSQKENYGADFEKVLKDSGYADEDTLFEIQKIQLHMQKVYENIEKEPTKYITKSIIDELGDDKVTVHHILIGFDAAEDGTVSDEAKQKAKNTADEVYAKIKSGENFYKMMSEYNTDYAEPEEGYTFGQDGSMVKEFEDASFSLEMDEVSQPVESPYGYHIIKRVERNISVDEYITAISKTVPVNIKKGVYEDMRITIDLNNYFAGQEETQTEENAE